MKRTSRLAALLFGAVLVASACSSAATTAPTAAPTAAPATEAPTAAPTEAPTAAPTEPAAATPPSDPLGVVTITPGEPIHIGQWGVFSGANASLGQDSNEGIQIAVDDRGGNSSATTSA